MNAKATQVGYMIHTTELTGLNWQLRVYEKLAFLINYSLLLTIAMVVLIGCGDDVAGPYPAIDQQRFFLLPKSFSYSPGDTITLSAEWTSKIAGSGRVILTAQLPSTEVKIYVIGETIDTLCLLSQGTSNGPENERQIELHADISRYKWVLVFPSAINADVRFRVAIVVDSIDLNGTRLGTDDSALADAYPDGISSLYLSENYSVATRK
jgi:hypothetical protein